jgi:hypothetical protein
MRVSVLDALSGTDLVTVSIRFFPVAAGFTIGVMTGLIAGNCHCYEIYENGGDMPDLGGSGLKMGWKKGLLPMRENGKALFCKKNRIKSKTSDQSNEKFILQIQFPFVCFIVKVSKLTMKMRTLFHLVCLWPKRHHACFHDKAFKNFSTL